MKECIDDDEKYSLSMVVAVKKLPYNWVEDSDSNSIAFYSPTILANAGFHNESANLHKFLQEKFTEENE
jgi:hypothetical protein